MKSTFKITCLCLLFFWAACEPEMVMDADLIGTWAPTAATCDDGTTTTTISGTTTISTFTFNGKDFNNSITFNDGGSYTSQGTYTQEVNTTVNGQTSTQEIQLNDFSASGNWTLSGSTLTLASASQGPQAATVLSLTSSSMRLRFDISTSATLPGGGMTSSSSTVFYTFSKQ